MINFYCSCKEKVLSETAIKYLFILTAFCIPLKLSFTYAGLLPLLLIWSIRHYRRIQLFVTDDLLLPFSYFLGYTALTSFAGFDGGQSLIAIVRFSFIGIFILITGDFARKFGSAFVLRPFLAGTALSTLYLVISSLINYLTGTKLPRVFLGAVTQSGQLAMSSILIFGVFFYLIRKKEFSKQLVLSGICLISVFAALIINLKRGPWIGVFFGLTFFSLYFSARLTMLIISISSLIIFTFDQVYLRLAGSIEDFLISGGRSDIWDIGVELITNYPLGIGYGNSPYLRFFSEKIPPELQHFHSNLLNILVETGWIGLLFFLWWLARLFKFCFIGESFSEKDGSSSNSEKRYIIPLIGSALISWQISGLVEYNFGDSEVILVVYLLIGMLSGLERRFPCLHS